MIRRSHKPAALRDAWTLPPDDGSRGRWLRRLRRLAALLCLLLLSGYFTYLLLAPFWHPTLHPVVSAVLPYDGVQIRPLPYAWEDAHAVREPLGPGQPDTAEVGVHVVESAEDLRELEASLATLPAGRRDLPIVYVAAQGVVLDGVPYLLCQNFDPTNPDEGRYPLKALLTRLSKSTAGVKLLILDAGDLDYDPRLGTVVNEFPRLLQESLRELGDASVWVLASHSPLETAHAIHGKRQSVFGRFVAEGLKGTADLDGDGLLKLGEFYGYVQRQVGRYVHDASGGRWLQTPMLLQGGQDMPKLSATPTLRSVGGLQLSTLTSASATAKKDATAADAATAKSAGDSAKKAVAEKSSKESAKSESATKPATTASNDQPSSKERSNENSTTPTGNASTAKAPESLDPHNLKLPAAGTKLKDLLDAAQRMTAALDRIDSAQKPHPLSVAAPAWKAWRERLRAYDDVVRFDPRMVEDEVAQALRRDFAALAGQGERDPTAPPTPLEAGFEPLRSNAPLPAGQVPSWALAERAQAWDHQPAPAAVATWLAKFEAALTDDARWRELTKQPIPAEADRYVECRWAKRLLVTPGVPAPLRQLAWRCQRQAEALAADPAATIAWIRSRLEFADAHRRAGERTLRDQLRADWAAAAQARFERALNEYSAAARGLAEIQAARRTHQQLLDRAEHYLRWYQASAGDEAVGPPYGDVRGLLVQLAAFGQVLEQLDSADLPTLANRHDQIQLVRARVEAPLQPTALQQWLASASRGSGAQRRAEVLLQSGLVPVEFVARLWDVAGRTPFNERWPANERPPTSVQPKIIAADDWTQLARQLSLELLFARLATTDDDRKELDELEALIRETAPEIVDQETPGAMAANADRLWPMWRASGARLAKIRGETAARAARLLDEHVDLRDDERRAAALVQLRAADRLLRLVDARDAGRAGTVDVAARLRRADAYDLMRWHRTRALAALADAPRDEADDALAQAALCRRLAQDLPQEPPVSDQTPPLPAIDGTNELPLVTQAQRELTLRFRPPAGLQGPAWLILDYDATLIEVQVAEVPAHQEREVREQLAQRASGDAGATDAVVDYPLRPADAGIAPSWEIAEGAAREFRLNVRRKASIGRSTRLVVKFLGRDFAVRHEVLVAMSTLDALALLPSGLPTTWSQHESLLQLHPLPNQRTEYRFTLANHGETEKTVDVDLVALRRPLASPSILTLPTQEAFDQIGPFDVIGQAMELKLPQNGQPVPFVPGAAAAPAADSKENGKDSAMDSTKDESSKQSSRESNPLGRGIAIALAGGVNGGADDEPSADAPKPDANPLASAGPPPLAGQRMNHGLLFIVRDRETKQTLFRRVEFRPLQPRAFLTVAAGYDVTQQRIELVVKPRDRALVPAAGMKVRCETPEPLPAGTESRLEGLINAPQFEARLYLRVPADEGRVQSLAVSVDGYPRAFFFRVPCGVASANLPEADDVLAVRVRAPEPGKWFKAPVETIPVRVEIDAPRGSFANDRDFVEIGLDADRDRELRGEVSQVFGSDRQAEVATTGFVGAVFPVATQVGDFQFDLPTGGLQNVRANVLGRVNVGARTAWSTPAEIILDGAPPIIRRAQVNPNTPAIADGEIEVVVGAVDGQMSGVNSVEVGLDPRFAGTFGPASAPVPAAPSDPTVWIAKLPLMGVEAGPTQILVRATDKAGNASDFTRLQVMVLPKGSADPTKNALPGRVSGTVQYGERAIPNAEVHLEGAMDPKTKKRKPITSTKADAEGRFTISDVPPGKYHLRVRGLANNRTRLGSQEVTIVSPPGQTPAVLIKAK